VNIIAERPELGLIEDLEREDDVRGPEPEPDEAVFHQLVQQLVPLPMGGAGQCSVCGGWFEGWSGGVCSACKSLAELDDLVPALVWAQKMPDDEDDGCPICGYWICQCGTA